MKKTKQELLEEMQVGLLAKEMVLDIADQYTEEINKSEKYKAEVMVGYELKIGRKIEEHILLDIGFILDGEFDPKYIFHIDTDAPSLKLWGTEQTIKKMMYVIDKYENREDKNTTIIEIYNEINVTAPGVEITEIEIDEDNNYKSYK